MRYQAASEMGSGGMTVWYDPKNDEIEIWHRAGDLWHRLIRCSNYSWWEEDFFGRSPKYYGHVYIGEL